MAWAGPWELHEGFKLDGTAVEALSDIVASLGHLPQSSKCDLVLTFRSMHLGPGAPHTRER
jgi:hypothetical protein